MKALPASAKPTELALFSGLPGCTDTPIAAEMQAHFDRGGTPADGVRLVAMLERAAARALTIVKPKNEAAGRGSRLPADWTPSHSEVAFARARDMPQVRIDTEVEKFRNYWTAKSGAGATKRDWSATWRNWIITAMERGYGPASNRGQGPGTDFTPRRAPTGSDAILTGMARLARRVDERRIAEVGSGRQAPYGSDTPGELDLKPARTR